MANKPYHLLQAAGHLRRMRDRAAARLAGAIRLRGWTQVQAATYLGVRQPRISDLMRGRTDKFSLDWMVEMLLALDHPVGLVLQEGSAFERSRFPSTAADRQDAIAYFTQAIELDPVNAETYARRGSAYFDEGQYDLAIGDYTRSIELDPHRQGTRIGRCNAFMWGHQYRAALHDADDQVRLFPAFDAYNTRGIVHSCMGEHDNAIADYTQAIEFDAGRTGAYYNRARVYATLGRDAEALADWQKVLELDPTDTTARTEVEKGLTLFS